MLSSVLSSMIPWLPSRRFHLLLVEDNLGDAQLLSEALGMVDRAVVVHHVTTIHDGLRYLGRRDDFASAQSPFLIVLDLNLPKVDGLSGLSVIRDTPEWASIPIAIMTSSPIESERERALDLGVTAFVKKPSVWDDYLAIARVYSQCRHAVTGSAGSDAVADRSKSLSMEKTPGE